MNRDDCVAAALGLQLLLKPGRALPNLVGIVSGGATTGRGDTRDLDLHRTWRPLGPARGAALVPGRPQATPIGPRTRPLIISMALASRTRAAAGARPLARSHRAPAAASRRVIATQALFSFLQPKQQPKGKDPRAAELVGDLVQLCSRGTPAAADVAALVDELAAYTTPNALRSPLLWGTYDVLYCSKPTAVGGPLKAGPGPVLFPGQAARQTLEEPNVLVNEVQFKALGFLPGYSRQFGTIQPVSGDTFVLSITEGELNTGLGPQKKQFDIQRRIQVVYLDDTLRIARFLPDSDLRDSEADDAQQQREEEEILFVFKRVAEEEEAAEEEEQQEEAEEEEEEQPRAQKPLGALFAGTSRTTAGLATQAERQIRQQMREEGTSVVSSAAPRSGGTRRLPSFGSRQRAVVQEEEPEEVEDPRAARRRAQEEARAQRVAEAEAKRAAEEQRRAAEAKQRAAEEERAAKQRAAEEERARRQAEAEAKAQAAQEAKERAEAERAARAERAAAIKELLAELADEAREAAAATKEAAAALREVQKESGALLKQVAAAEAEVADADADVAKVSAALEEASNARKVAEQELKAAQQRVRDAQAAYKQTADAAFAGKR